MAVSLDLLMNAVISGLLLGGFYAAVSIGVAISFGMLDIVNIAHPAFILLGSYIAFIGNTVFGIDPILAALIMLPVFYVLGMVTYQVYYVAFERRDDQSLRGLSFFFGLLFITEVGLILTFGVDYRYVEARYIGPTWHIGFLDLPYRHGAGSLKPTAMEQALQRMDLLATTLRLELPELCDATGQVLKT
jgi:branched-chain amino acid transport system permease protein